MLQALDNSKLIANNGDRLDDLLSKISELEDGVCSLGPVKVTMTTLTLICM